MKSINDTLIYKLSG